MTARLLGLTILGSSFAIGGLWMHLKAFMDTPLNLPADGLVLEVPRGATAQDLADRLRALGAVSTGWQLRWQARWDGRATRLKAGEYRVVPGTTPDRLLSQLVAGATVAYRMTFVEGWNFRQVRAALARDPVLEQTLPGLSDEAVMELLGRPDEHPEGRFFPDTYRFPRGTRDIDVLRRAYDKMTRTLAEVWQDRAPDLPLATPYEALILASIVEKETGVPDERAQIAGVFVRRLRKNMKLQTDPTVIYGMGESFDGNIRRKDLRRDTPYNTYVHKGLTPTPIAMPGREALVASVNPAPGDALFFVARGDGSHQFSATLEAHNAAVRKYQLGQ